MPTLEFEGKSFVYSHHLSVPYRELVPIKGKGIGDPNQGGNLIVHGDNLEALKALLPRYAGKVDVIYIDPPYNTGKEGWAYNDKVSSPLMKEWLGKVVDKEDMQRHDKWLCMMWPRLSLLQELLSDTGVVLISIDDNELYNLDAILQEMFPDKARVGTIVWKNATDNNPTQIAIEHEYVLCFAKRPSSLSKVWKSRASAVKDLLVEIGTRLNDQFDDVDNLQAAYTEWFREHKNELWPLDRYKYIDKGGVYTGSQSVHNPGREGYRYDILHPSNGKPTKQPLMGYRFPEETYKELFADGRILFGDDEDKIIELKVYAKEYEAKLPSVIEMDGRTGAYDLRALFPEKTSVFKNPKPVLFIEELLSFLTPTDGIVLDSFAGSGTTAHAIAKLNAADGGTRKFILVETEDYADGLTAERVRRVMKGVSGAKDQQVREGLGGTFTYCELGEPMDAERWFEGSTAPSWEQVARYVIYTATGETASVPSAPKDDWLACTIGTQNVHVIYKPAVDFMRSPEAALTLELARSIAEAAEKVGRTALVFGAAPYVSAKEMRRLGITFVQLPWSVHQRVSVGASS